MSTSILCRGPPAGSSMLQLHAHHGCIPLRWTQPAGNFRTFCSPSLVGRLSTQRTCADVYARSFGVRGLQSHEPRLDAKRYHVCRAAPGLLIAPSLACSVSPPSASTLAPSSSERLRIRLPDYRSILDVLVYGVALCIPSHAIYPT
eukprot:1873655-Pyramimonas_sp.AAC.1